MKCPHCRSHMDNYQTTQDNRSQVCFYRCMVCDSEHVTASVVTSSQLPTSSTMLSAYSGNTSQIHAV
jgi:hypothetical protein